MAMGCCTKVGSWFSMSFSGTLNYYTEGLLHVLPSKCAGLLVGFPGLLPPLNWGVGLTLQVLDGSWRFPNLL
jgi:hypothetical protein